MSILVDEEQVLKLLQRTGALRQGHFILPNGLHTETYLQTEQVLRYYRNAQILAVGLSRLLRTVPSVRPHLPRVAIVTPSNSGIPVAFGVRDALDAEEIFWAERSGEGSPLHFPQFLEISPGEKFIVVNDSLRHGGLTEELCHLVTDEGGEILAVGTVIDLRVSRSPIAGHKVYSLLHHPVPNFRQEDCPPHLLEMEPVRIL